MMHFLWPRKSIQFLSVTLRTAFLKYFCFQDPIIVLKIVKNPEELLFMKVIAISISHIINYNWDILRIFTFNSLNDNNNQVAC